MATTVIEDLRALLNPLATNGAWYAVNSTEPPVYPYIVFQRVVSTPEVTLDGPTDLQNTRIQIDIYSRQISEAVGIEIALEAAMATASAAKTLINVPIASQDLYDDAVRAFRIIKEYSVWAKN